MLFGSESKCTARSKPWTHRPIHTPIHSKTHAIQTDPYVRITAGRSIPGFWRNPIYMGMDPRVKTYEFTIWIGKYPSIKQLWNHPDTRVLTHSRVGQVLPAGAAVSTDPWPFVHHGCFVLEPHALAGEWVTAMFSLRDFWDYYGRFPVGFPVHVCSFATKETGGWNWKGLPY